MKENFAEQVKAIVFGHAVGDAVGGPVQFFEREEVEASPVTDMLPLGYLELPKGAWSDDTSMSLCAMDALADDGLNFESVMENFGEWLYNHRFTPTDFTFDVGSTCIEAIKNYFKKRMPLEQCGLTGENNNGNGSLMRIYPFALYAFRAKCGLAEKIEMVHDGSALTHAHRRSLIGCGIYSFVLWELLENSSKQAIADGLKKAKEYYGAESELAFYHRLFGEDFALLPREKIESSGYVVDTLEAAIWCVLTTENYRECVLKAVNLGKDTDSVGAVAGSLAGLLYGYENIPEDWRESILKKDTIMKLCTRFAEKLEM